MANAFNIRSAPQNNYAILSQHEKITYSDLVRQIDERVLYLNQLPDGLLILGFSSDVWTIVTYLAAIESERPIMLIDPKSKPGIVEKLVEEFRPSLLGGVAGLPSQNLKIFENPFTKTPKSLIFLPTSGSTGSVKTVRLSVSAVLSNALSIKEALKIDANQIAPLNLPLFYSYGLSILNSHLVSGACLALTGQNFMEAQFWKNFDLWECTSLAGVPVNYEILKRLKFDLKKHPSLKIMTQAGGKLPLEIQADFHRLMSDIDGEFIVMYGQTEASARMSVLPHDSFLNKKGSVGFAIPGGSFKILNEELQETGPNTLGQIVYVGQNVMYGYSEKADDALQGDTVSGNLLTGDIGYLDEDDCLWISGRSKRIAKIFGTRVNLDDIEQIAFSHGYTVAALSVGEGLVVVIEGQHPVDEFVKKFAEQLGVHHSGIKAFCIDELPTLSSGKRDYSSISEKYGNS